MRVGIVTDAACDLPANFIGPGRVEILPVNLHVGTQMFVDRRDEAQTQRFYRMYLGRHDHQAITKPLPPKEIADLFLNDWVKRYDRILVLTVTSARSEIYKNTSEASYTILRDYKKVRVQANLTEPFLMRVFDTHTLFTGQGLMAFEALRMRDVGRQGFDIIRRQLETIHPKIRAYFLPNDVYYVYNRARLRGEESVNWLTYQIGSMLDVKPIIQMVEGTTEVVAKPKGFEGGLNWLFGQARTEIERGLSIKAVCMSYGGELDEIKRLAPYQEFVKFAHDRKVATSLALMSVTAGIYVGRGGFSIAYAVS